MHNPAGPSRPEKLRAAGLSFRSQAYCCVACYIARFHRHRVFLPALACTPLALARLGPPDANAGLQDAEGGTVGAGGPGSTVPSNKTPNKMNPTRQRGVVNRPIATSIARAQEEFKLFVTHPEDIDHNLYGRFLGILKGARPPALPPRTCLAHAKGQASVIIC